MISSDAVHFCYARAHEFRAPRATTLRLFLRKSWRERGKRFFLLLSLGGKVRERGNRMTRICIGGFGIFV